MTTEVKREPEMRILRQNKNIPQQMDSEDPDIVRENERRNKIIDGYPELIDNEGRVRFNPFTGVIYVVSFRPTTTISENGSPVVKQRYSRYGDIDTATRGMSDIVGKYNKGGGEEVENTRRIVKTMEDLLARFRAGGITHTDLAAISEATIQQLDETGFSASDKSVKQELVRKLTLATQPDSLGRVNPLISRSRIASAWLKATRELLLAKYVREKYQHLYVGISGERATERFYLDQVARYIDGILAGGGTDRELASSLAFLKDYSNSYLAPEVIRANPYRGPALEVNADLFGPRRLGREGLILDRYIGRDRTADVFDQTPITQLSVDTSKTKFEKWGEISKRLRAARNRLTSVLEFGEENIKPKEERASEQSTLLKVPA